jgi:hypothetical protein
MTIQPFSNQFAEEFRRVQSIVETLEARLLELSRTNGSMYDRLTTGGSTNQFMLFCDITSGEAGESYKLKPAFDFYGLDDEEDSDQQKLQQLGAPSFVLDAFDNGTVSAKNCVDHRFDSTSGATNLHGVNAPLEQGSGQSGQISILDIAPASSNNTGVGSVLAVFTEKLGGVHVGFYGKNDLAVTCGTDTEVQGFLRNGAREKIDPPRRVFG